MFKLILPLEILVKHVGHHLSGECIRTQLWKVSVFKMINGYHMQLVLPVYICTLFVDVLCFVNRANPFLSDKTLVNNLRQSRKNCIKSDSSHSYGIARETFPIFSRKSPRSLIYFDNAATTQKPKAVLDAVIDFYTTSCSNVHRSYHHLATSATERYEKSRNSVANFINANCVSEIVFSSGATDSINLVANVLSEKIINEGDCILLSLSEHNSNIIPWQMLRRKKGCSIKFIGIREDGSINLDHYKRLLESNNVKLVSIAHASNVLGKVQDLREITELAHQNDSLVLVDACQTLGHIEVDVKKLNCDFLVGSGHKMYGPTGIGFLFGKLELLERLNPWKGGGNMVENVTLDSFECDVVPYKFEAGSPQVAQAVGLSAAINFIAGIGFEKISLHERELTKYLYEGLKEKVRIHGFDKHRLNEHNCPIISFTVDGVNTFDLASMLSSKGIAIRAGRHCANILHTEFLKVDGTLRVSLAMYNSKAEIDIFLELLDRNIELLRTLDKR